MNNDTRLAVSAHILALLSFDTSKYFTSELLARSVNTNPVVIRRLIGQLKKAGFVTVRPGVGGSALVRAPESITLLDVYDAVIPREKNPRPFFVHQEPSSRCFVGRNIHAALAAPLAKVDEAMRGSLAATTIADIAACIRARLEKEKAA